MVRVGESRYVGESVCVDRGARSRERGVAGEGAVCVDNGKLAGGCDSKREEGSGGLGSSRALLGSESSRRNKEQKNERK